MKGSALGLELHPAAVQALSELKHQPVIDAKVFPIRGAINERVRVSRLFADLCCKVGLTTTVERRGRQVIKNRWCLRDLRRKANTDLRNRGASAKERAALLGQRTPAVNEAYYEGLLPSRERELIDGLPIFGMTA